MINLQVDIDEDDLYLAGCGDGSGYYHLGYSVIEALKEKEPELYKEYFED